MRKIVFVDDERRVLDGLRRMLHPYRREWRCVFFDNGPEALEHLASEPVDVVVSDMRMPGMDGSALLRNVQRDHPDIIRIILSGQSENEAILRSVGPAHQFLSKPCSAQEICDAISRSCDLRDLLHSDKMREIIGGLASVPVLPNVLLEIREALQSDTVSVALIADIVARDLGLSAKILQLVNSSFFGLRRHCDSVAQAVTFLGVETIQSLVLATSLFSQLDACVASQVDVASVANHCLRTADLAKRIAVSVECATHVCDHAYLAASIHDIGKIVLAANDPGRFASVVQQSGGLARTHVAEQAALGVTHAHVGAYLLGLWAFPHPVVEAVCHHHDPQFDGRPEPAVTPLALLHVANAIMHAHDEGCAGPGDLLDMDYIRALQLESRLDEWRRMAHEGSVEVTP